MTAYIVIGNDLRDNALHLHRAFSRFRDAEECIEKLNCECTKQRLPRLYYMYIMEVEER